MADFTEIREWTRESIQKKCTKFLAASWLLKDREFSLRNYKVEHKWTRLNSDKFPPNTPIDTMTELFHHMNGSAVKVMVKGQIPTKILYL